jgi:tetratricopeptide (TPR) repeat protein
VVIASFEASADSRERGRNLLRRSGALLTSQVAPLILTLACCLLGPSLKAQPASLSADDQAGFQSAMAALDAGNSQLAKPILEKLHGRYPSNFAINESLGLLYASGGDVTTALPLMTAAASEQPDSDAAAANLGIAYLKAGRDANAARELDRAVQLNPRNLLAEEALGQALMQLHQPAEAAAMFHRALTQDEKNPTLLYNAALADFNSGDAAQAASLLARMPEAESSAEAQSLMADVEEKLGNFKSAGQHYLNAARLDPTEANEYAVGVEFLRHWTFPPAVTQFGAGVQRFPASRRMRLGLGIAYFGNHNYDQAIPVFTALLAEEPDNAAFADLLGRTCSVVSEGSDSRCSVLIAFAEKHPHDAKAATYAAIHILHQPEGADQRDQAKKLLESALASDPRLAEAHYELGVLLELQEKWAESTLHLEKAVQLQPDYAAAHYRLAIAYRRLGQSDKAQEQVRLQQKFSTQQAKERDLKLEQIQTLLVTTR